MQGRTWKNIENSTGEKVALVGFGTFQVMERKARRGRNPQTGETVQIPAKKVPRFRPGRGLRERVKQKKYLDQDFMLIDKEKRSPQRGQIGLISCLVSI